MHSPTIFQLNSLSLKNFRCFTKCRIDLDSDLTVLVAENGRGKTAILDAIGISLGLYVDTIAGTRQSRGFERSDVHLLYENGKAMRPELPTELEASADIADQRIKWNRALNRYADRAKTTTKGAEKLRQAAYHLRTQIVSDTEIVNAPPDLPLIAFYGTGRLWSEHRLMEWKKDPTKIGIGRMSGYTDCLSSSSSFKGVVAWYEATMNEARDPRSTAIPSIKRPEKLLAAVREATRTVLAPTGWCELDWDFTNKILVVEHADYGRLPLSILSDGIRNMIALVADIAFRCVSLNPHFGEDAARLTHGVLLIDEVDMHLHPRWQQQVVALLRKAFPELQIIVSTHSPHVLSTVDAQSIRIIHLRDGEGEIETPTFQTRGVESADVLAKIMNVDPVPQVEEAQWLSRYRALVQTAQHNTEDGLQLWDKVVEHFGIDHPVIHEVETLKKLQEFKLLRNLK